MAGTENDRTRRNFIRDVAAGASMMVAAGSVGALAAPDATQLKSETALLNELKSLKGDLQLLKDKNEIGNVLSRYAFRFDLERLEQWYELWDEDGVFNSSDGEQPLHLKGKAAIRVHFDQEKRSEPAQHAQVTELIKVAGDRATALNYEVTFDVGGDGMGRVAKRSVRCWSFVKKNGHWLIKQADSADMADKQACLELMPPDW